MSQIPDENVKILPLTMLIKIFKKIMNFVVFFVVYSDQNCAKIRIQRQE